MTGRVEVWEIRLAVDAAIDHVRDLRVSIDGADWLERAVDHVCDMHGIDHPNDRDLIKIGLEEQFDTRSVAA